MTELKACLFDLDGVIVDTAKYHFRAWQQITEELGIPFSLDDNEKLKGVSRMDSLEIILGIGEVQLSNNEKLELANRKNEVYKEFISKMDESEILPGVRELLDTLKECGIKVALGSSSKNAKTILRQVGIFSQFDFIVDGNMVQKSKPDPEVFLFGAKQLGARPDQCVVFEDAKAGIEAAVKADMLSIGIGSPEVLYKANMVVPSLDVLSLNSIHSLFKVKLEA